MKFITEKDRNQLEIFSLNQVISEENEVRLIDLFLQGQLIKETAESQFDLSNYPNGMYFIKAQTKEGFYSYKILKH